MRKFNSLVASVRTISEKTRAKNAWKLNFRAFFSHIFAKKRGSLKPNFAKNEGRWSRNSPKKPSPLTQILGIWAKYCSQTNKKLGPNSANSPPTSRVLPPGRIRPLPDRASRVPAATSGASSAFSPRVAFTGHGGRLNRPRPSHWPNADRYSSVLADRM